jgi:uncharacterized protein
LQQKARKLREWHLRCRLVRTPAVCRDTPFAIGIVMKNIDFLAYIDGGSAGLPVRVGRPGVPSPRALSGLTRLITCDYRPPMLREHSMYHPPSPCTGICRIEQTTGRCEGCMRTLKEIADWPMLRASEKRAVLDDLPSRSSP